MQQQRSKKEVTAKLYGKWCLPVITWYKKDLLKQVSPTTYTPDKKFFAAATFEDLWVDPFQADQKAQNLLWSMWVFLAFLQMIRPYKNSLWEVDLVFYMKIFRLMCQTVNLFWKIAVYNAGCVFRLYLWRTQKSFLVKILSLL